MLSRRTFLALPIALVAAAPLAAHPPTQPEPKPAIVISPAPEPGVRDGARPVIQIAILLDTSGSMQGLINQARSRLWDVVNVMSTARKNGRRPEFQVAVYQYGSDRLPPGEGFLTMIQPFTTDLDLISEKLFALTIGGSEEYCGQVMHSALRQLSWNPTSPTAPIAALPLRMVIIAGNEPFTQGSIDYRSPVAHAKERGVLINTIYCGPYSDGEGTGWLNAAHLGGGAFNAIDQNQRYVEVPCPQDDDLIRLNTELNGTYIPYGSGGREYQARQSAQDSGNFGLSKSGGLSRVAAKSSANYTNAHWDLIDAVTNKSIDLEKIATTDLPDVMRPMTLAERQAHIAKMQARRADIQNRIRQLSTDRTKFLTDHRNKPAGETLDSAIIKAIRDQAAKAGFTFAAD